VTESGIAATPTADELISKPTFVEVAVPLHVAKTFIYRLSDNAALAKVGARILVPLGRNLVTGYVVALHTALPDLSGLTETDVKDAASLVDTAPICTPEILDITRWVSDYYASPWGEVIKAALPPGISPAINEILKLTPAGQAELDTPTDESTLRHRILERLAANGECTRSALDRLATPNQLIKTIRELEQSGRIERTQTSGTSPVKTKLVRFVSLNVDEPQVETPKRTPAQQRILATLAIRDPISLRELLNEARVGPATVTTLQKQGVLRLFNQAVRRDPFLGAAHQNPAQYTLTPAQELVLQKVTTAISENSYAAFLLHGVTGSGKTEVYIRAMRAALDQGCSAMMLVPEIALTPVFSRRLREHFGHEVAIFH
jgi:primosomal protein N' (replication factor Y)